jgi:hypothetical protein
MRYRDDSEQDYCPLIQRLVAKITLMGRMTGVGMGAEWEASENVSTRSLNHRSMIYNIVTNDSQSPPMRRTKL